MDLISEFRGEILLKIYDLTEQLISIDEGTNSILLECDESMKPGMQVVFHQRTRQELRNSIIEALQLRTSEQYIREIIQSAYDKLPPNLVTDEFGVIHV